MDLEPNRNRELAICTTNNQWIIGYYMGNGQFRITTRYSLKSDGSWHEETSFIHIGSVKRWVELDVLPNGLKIEPRGNNIRTDGFTW